MKDFFLTDEEIRHLIAEPKHIGYSISSLLNNMKSKSGRASSHRQYSHQFSRASGEGDWLIYLRYNKLNSLDFSCGFGFIPQGRNQTFMLRRYNGKSHQHTNYSERQSFYDFHIHEATERYQKSSYNEDHYATPTNRYVQLDGALKCLLDDFHVQTDDSGQQTLL